MTKLALILGDQLSLEMSNLKYLDKEKDFILLAEVRSESSYVKHHKQKIILIFSAMRHFARELEGQGYRVLYTKFDDPKNTHSISAEIIRNCQNHNVSQILVTKPGEIRLLQELENLRQKIDIRFFEDERFFCSNAEFNNWAKGKKELVMEYFYRNMRIKSQILMKENKPEGGKWNFDKENRSPLKRYVSSQAMLDSNSRCVASAQQSLGPKNKTDKLFRFSRIKFELDDITQEVINLVEKEFSDYFGETNEFAYAVTRKDALKAFDYFLENNLANFGDFQDAMLEGESFLFHSIISPYLNIGLLNSKEVCKKAEEYYYQGKAPLNAVEGFIRQILGWREYIRGIYWRFAPNYLEKNFLEAKNNLPQFYWDGKTNMNCLKNVINSTIKYGYSHHIQRLMITGNFALLTGVDIKQIHQWYLAVYVDAFEWVEAPNVIGMSQYGDGGIVATKPYISGGAYINRMSNFCKNCQFDVKTNDQENSCPFNYLYWNFLIKHQDKFKNNHRMAIAYKNLGNMSDKKRQDIVTRSNNFNTDY